MVKKVVRIVFHSLLSVFGIALFFSRTDPEPVVGADGTIIFHRFIYFVLTNGFILFLASFVSVQGQFSPSAGVQRCSKAGVMCNEFSTHNAISQLAFVIRSLKVKLKLI